MAGRPITRARLNGAQEVFIVEYEEGFGEEGGFNFLLGVFSSLINAKAYAEQCMSEMEASNEAAATEVTLTVKSCSLDEPEKFKYIGRLKQSNVKGVRDRRGAHLR